MKGFRVLGEKLFSLGLTQRLGLGQRHTAGGDTTAPTVVITCAQSDNTSVTPLNFTFMLSEVATDFAIGDITVGGVGGTKSNFAGSGVSYTCDIAPSALGDMTVDVAGGAFHDAAGNSNTDATQFTIHVLPSLIAYWKLDEFSDGSGAVTRNDSHGTNHLTDNGTTPSAAAKISNGINTNPANNEYLDIIDNAAMSVGDIDFTFTVWVKADVLTNNTGLLGKWGVVAEYALFFISSRFRFAVKNSSDVQTNVDANSLGAPSTGTYYFIVCGHDSVTNKIFIQVNNGTVDEAVTSTGVRDGANNFYIAKYTSAADEWDGLVDEVGFWKRYLSLAERTALYNGGTGITYPF